MGTVIDLVAKISAQLTGFHSAMIQGAQSTDKFAQSWQKAGQDVATAAVRITTVTGTLIGGFAAFSSQLGLAFNAGQENAKIMFTTLLGDGELAKKKLTEILSLSKSTPFSFAGIRDGAIQFLNAQVSAEELIPRLRAVGDAVSAIGGNDESLKGVTMALSQMMTSGKLNAGDMLQMTTRGILAWDILAEHFGKTVAEIRKMSESGDIDGREAANAIMDGMARRFQGASGELGLTFNGLWSSLADNFAEKSGEIFEPLSNAVKGVMAQLNGAFESGAASATIFRLKEAVASIVYELEQLASENGAGIIRNLADGFVWLAEGAAKFTRYLAEQGPALMETASGWLALLKPIAQFLADHPQVLAALVALKVGGMLGLNQAAYSLANALVQTITSMAGLSTAAGGASGALAVLSRLGMAAVIVAVAVAAHQAATEMSGWGEETRKAAAEMKAAMEEARKLDALRDDRRDEAKRQNREAVERATDPEQKKQILRGQLAIAEREAQGAGASARGAEKNAADLESQWGGSLSNVAKVAREEATAAAEEALSAAREVDRIKREIQRIDRETAAEELNAAKKLNAEKIQSKIGGGEPVAVGPNDQAKADKQAMKEEARRQDTADDKVGQFTEKLRDLQGTVPTIELQAFAMVFQELRNQFLEGEIDADEYRDSLKYLDNRMRDAAQVGTQTQGLADHTQSAAERLDTHSFGPGSQAGVSEGVLGNANAKYDAIEQAGQHLAKSFQAGQISATQYAQEITRLKKATDDVTDAAIKEEQQKRKEALLKNDFKGAGLDFNESVQQKIQERLISQKMSEFDSAVDSVVNQFFPLATIVSTVSDGLNALDTGLAKVGNTIGNMVSGGGGGNDGQAMQNWINYLTSKQGQVDSLVNNISLLQQALTALTDPTRIKELTDSIANLNRQIAAINNQVHTFTGHVSNDPIFKDPGITGGGTQRSVTINNHFPYVLELTQTQVERFSHALGNHWSQQGQNPFH